MPFTGNEDHSISLEDATEMTENYRQATGLGLFLGAYFGKTAISDILSQDNCVGIRIYNAKSNAGKLNFVLVGVNANGDDMYDGELAEMGIACPPFCPTSSPLNGTA